MMQTPSGTASRSQSLEPTHAFTTYVLESPSHVVRQVADEVARVLTQSARASRPCVLGLATGSTMTGVYRELVRRHREEGLSFAHAHTFNLDEYWPLAPEHPLSYRAYMNKNLFDHVDIDRANTHLPDGRVTEAELESHCRQYEEKIRSLGGLDLQLLGIGRNGHIGFNEPPADPESRTRRVPLAESTRTDAARDWGGIDQVPTSAITMGMGTILSARRIVLVALGEKKRDILRQSVEGPVDPAVPASFLQRHAEVCLVADREAGEFK